MSSVEAEPSGKAGLAALGLPVLENLSFTVDDQEQRILVWGPKAAEVLGYGVRDMHTKVWHERLAPPDSRWEAAGRVSRACQALRAHGGSQEVVLTLVAADGRFSCMKFLLLHAPGALPRAAKCQAFKLFCVGHTPLSEEVQPWPLRHAEVPGAGIATFATRAIEAGETILEEEPFFTRLQPAAMRNRKEWDDHWASEFNSIQAPLQLPGALRGTAAAPLLASAALVRNALGYAGAHSSIQEAIMGLSCPPLDLDHALVEVSRQVAVLCRRRLQECSTYDEAHLQKAVLISEMNTFPGGRMFWTLSRLNHSCAPNCVFLSVPGRWGLRALRQVAAGEELTISYLGEELLWPTMERRRLLWRSKAFICACPRCIDPVDRVLDRPCVRCASLRRAKAWRVVHQPGIYCRSEPSIGGKAVGFLSTGTVMETTGRVERTREGTWVEIDTERHRQGGWMLLSGEHLGKGLGQLLDPVVDEAPEPGPPLPGCRLGKALPTGGLLEDRFRKDYGQAVKGSLEVELDAIVRRDCRKLDKLRLPRFLEREEPDGEEVSYAQFQGECWLCPRCGYEENSPSLLGLEHDLGEQARKLLSMRAVSQFPRMEFGNSRKLPMPGNAYVQAVFRLADDAKAVFGRRHYAWQLGLLFSIDLDLALPKYVNLQKDASFYLHTASSLLELWDWLSSCGISQEPTVWLHQRASELLSHRSRLQTTWGTTATGKTCEEVFSELQRRADEGSPATMVDLLGPREFIPAGLLPAS